MTEQRPNSTPVIDIATVAVSMQVERVHPPPLAP